MGDRTSACGMGECETGPSQAGMGLGSRLDRIMSKNSQCFDIISQLETSIVGQNLAQPSAPTPASRSMVVEDQCDELHRRLSLLLESVALV